jgi:integrase
MRTAQRVSSYGWPEAAASGSERKSNIIRPYVIKDGDDIRFGFHTLRHGLASYLVQQGKDPKTFQTLLRHADVAATLGIYAHSRNADRMAAQEDICQRFSRHLERCNNFHP